MPEDVDEPELDEAEPDDPDEVDEAAAVAVNARDCAEILPLVNEALIVADVNVAPVYFSAVVAVGDVIEVFVNDVAPLVSESFKVMGVLYACEPTIMLLLAS